MSTSTSATVMGLTNGRGYMFRVSAKNGIGTGAISTPSVTVTPRTVPGTASNVAGVAGNGQVSLTWTAPASDGGSAITDYVVEYKTTTASIWTTFKDGVSTSTAATVMGLTNGTSYVFRVSAKNEIGTGATSAQPGTVTPKATSPGAPTDVAGTTGNRQVNLSWTAPASDGGSAIMDYVVEFKTTTATTWTTFNDGVSTATSATVTGLTNGKGYVFRVSAKNAIGRGRASVQSVAVIPRV